MIAQFGVIYEKEDKMKHILIIITLTLLLAGCATNSHRETWGISPVLGVSSNVQ